MNKIIAILFATVALMTSASVGSAADLKTSVNATKKVYTNQTGYCSSTVVAKDTLLTAGHCSDEKIMNTRMQKLNDKFELVYEEVVYLKRVKYDDKHDLALFQPIDPSYTFKEAPVSLATPEDVKNLEIGQTLVAIGYPKAQIRTVTKGEFTDVTHIPGSPWEDGLYQITVPITGGNSGGGLYVTDGNDYRLLGVTVAGYKDVSFMNYATTYEQTMAILSGFVDNEDVKKAASDLQKKKFADDGGMIDGR